ncbi:CotH kinase family protein [Mariniphaga sp.]|uniref:CotH kinase family protein n=1 Tax=Mariniphaga sp. TaxID=1954475 RepID=UPI0035664B78
MFGFYKIIFAQLFIIIIWSGCTPVNNTFIQDEGFEKVFRCSAEEINDSNYSFRESSNASLGFGNVDARSTETSYNGDFSLKLRPGKPYGFTTELEVGPDEYIQVTAWRKSSGDNGTIVIDGGSAFYHASKKIAEESDNEWQKVFMEIYTPPDFYSGTVKIYVWNPSLDTVYFDDIQIVHRNKKVYPEFDPLNALHIYAEPEHLSFFNAKRIEAFDKGVLVNEDADYTGAVIFDGNEFFNGGIRLKGDLTDHIQGDKWSFRIKLKKDFAWNHVRTFSVQDPATRNFLHEWLAHQIFDREDILTTRYGFVPLYINNQSRGIYAWEEHFEKHLVESRNRREGPIVRFDETLFWNRIMEFNQTEKLWDVDYFGAAKITPFKESSTTSDSLKNRQTVEAQKLLLQYKNWSVPVSSIFDIDKLARYYALMDITQAYHGFTWHNQRFYFNPVTCLLEPIAFDGFIEGGIFKRIDEPVTSLLDPTKIAGFNKEELLLYQVFTDSLFNRKYVKYLKKYSDENYITRLISLYHTESDSLASIIRQEFPYYRFNFNFLKEQGQVIRENMDAIEANIPKLEAAFLKVNREKFKKQFTTEFNSNLTSLLVHAYFNKANGQLQLLNYHGGEVSLTGALITDNLPQSFSPNVVLPPYDGLNPGKTSVTIQGEPYRILFKTNDAVFETEVKHWAFDDGASTRQMLIQQAVNENLPWHNDSLIFDGEYVFSSDVYIPPHTPLVFKPGTQIDLINGAGFFSFSAMMAEGEEGNPVEFYSSDKSSHGVHVLQTSKRSELKHTRFFQLGSINRGGWQTPSAVTFYEADVNFYYCTFEANVNCDDALNTVRSDFLAENCHFINTFADAFDSDFCTGQVLNSKFRNIGNDAIDFSGSQVLISDCTMFEINDKAISGGENSQLTVKNCTIDKATIGVAAKDLSHLELDNTEIRKTVYAFVAFVKKPEYGPATISAQNIDMKGNLTLHQVEIGSEISVNGAVVQGREKNLALKLYQ